MDLGLKGKVALITGAGSPVGFGRGISLTLAREGCDIVVNDIDEEGARKTAAEKVKKLKSRFPSQAKKNQQPPAEPVV